MELREIYCFTVLPNNSSYTGPTISTRSPVTIALPNFSNPRRDTVRLKVEAPYAAKRGMFFAMAPDFGGGCPTCLEETQTYGVSRIQTHSYVPRTHSEPQAIKTPTLPLRISP